MFRIRRRSAGMALALSATVACSRDAPPADWSLAIAPHAHPNQDLTRGEPVAKLVMRRSAGDLVIPLGEVTAGAQLRAEDLPSAEELADVTAMGIAIEPPGGPDDDVGNDLLAYGEAPVAGLAPGADLALDVLVSELGTIGDLGKLPATQQRFLRGVALVPPGAVWLFGGGVTLAEASADVFALRSLDAGAPWKFEKVGTLPGNGEDPRERLGLTATTVHVDGAPLVLVAGGRGTWFESNGNSRDWWLFDPATEEFVAHGQLKTGRAEHGALLQRDGRVLLYGGYTGQDGTSDPEVELFDPVTRKSELVDLHTAGTGYAVASLGDAGVIACGGFDLVGLTTARVTDACRILNLQGVTRDAAPLPVPLARLALAPVGEGYVLATGGFTATGDIAADETFEATTDAWLYDVSADTWQEVAPLGLARSAHVAIELSNRRVLVVGGTSADGPLSLPAGEVGCPELFDPATATFRVLQDQCGTWGAGSSPGFASWPGEGAVLLKGYTTEQAPQDAIGFVGLGPG